MLRPLRIKFGSLVVFLFNLEPRNPILIFLNSGNCLLQVKRNDLLFFSFGFLISSSHILFRQLAEAGAHVVMAVRKPNAAQDLIQKWQTEWSGMGLPLNVEVLGGLVLCGYSPVIVCTLSF